MSRIIKLEIQVIIPIIKELILLTVLIASFIDKDKAIKKGNIYVGIDVSKSTLDICSIDKHGEKEFFEIKNKSRSIVNFITKEAKKYSTSEIHVAMENTGYYNWNTYEAFEDLSVKLYVINPLHLKKSMGLVRGKNDRIDAARIASFIAINLQHTKPFCIPIKIIRQLQVLTAQRNRLIKSKTGLKIAEKELNSLDDKTLIRSIHRQNQTVIKSLEKSITLIEKQMHELIQNDLALNQKFNLITSVPGVGKLVAWELLIKTNEFITINDPRKLACYAGVVPFDFQSGVSINRKPRVSLLADRKLKKLLHMAALRVTQLKGEMQNYYLRKIDEGKNKMPVINALRNKIVARVSATIKNQKKYQDFSLILS